MDGHKARLTFGESYHQSSKKANASHSQRASTSAEAMDHSIQAENALEKAEELDWTGGSTMYTAKHCEALRSTAKHCEAMRSNAKQCEAMRSNIAPPSGLYK